MDVKDKIQKLLALAGSDNENEAKAALLKARELMAANKLSEADFKDMQKKKVVELDTGVDYTLASEPWVIPLSVAICTNYCCISVNSHLRRKKTRRIIILGLEDDAEVCSAVFKYACEFVRGKCKDIAGENKGADAVTLRQLKKAYGLGFAAGVEKMYEKQTEEHSEWGLVLSVPTEVSEAAPDSVFHARYSSGRSCEEQLYRKAGYDDGLAFDPSTKLESKD